MKVAVALILCAITLARGQEVELNENGCPIDYRHELLYAHEICNKFYQCTHGELVVHTCAGDLLFNVDKQECDWPHDTDCGHRVIPQPESEESEKEVSTEGNASQESEGDNNSDNGGDNNGNGDNNTICNCNPGEAPAICAGSNSEGKLIAHENCNQFYKCSQGVPVAISCYGNLLYNPYSEQCDWPSNVECGDRVIPECDDDNNNNGDNDSNGDNASGGDNSGENGSGDNNNGDNNSGDDNNSGGNGVGENGNENGTGSCNCNPGEAPSICAGSGSEGLLIAHENCNQFYKCSHGVPVAMSCYGDLLYNPYIEQCDWPSNVECGNRVIPECDDDNNNNGDNDSNGDNASGGDNNGENGSGDNNNGDNNSGDDNNSGGNGDSENGNENGTGSCNCNPGEAPSICAGSGSEGLLIAHENCNQFYKCSHGVPVAMSCYGDLLYNPYTEQCDWPSNVECGNRVIPECDDDNNNNGDNDSNGDNASGGDNNGENGSGDNNNGDNNSGYDNNSGGNGDGENGNENGTGSCNCNPGEAPSICAGSGSEGLLIAHVNCNQFYKCSHGVPVAMSCYGDLLYNPYTEQCDWPTNVECGDRVIPECDDNNNGDNNSNGDNASGGNNNGENGSGDNNNGDNGSGDDNNNGGNGDGDNGNENGTGSCNCNPGEAPSICAGSGSEGLLIAHENCNQFYKCSHGVPVAMSCYGDLLYNPYTEQCDWPSNVECGDRVIPECDDNNNGDNNSNGDNASGGNNNGENGSGDNNNGDNGSGDDNNNGGNGDGDNGNENGTGSCNCNPGEAPSICAGSGSEGLLIAHENCNQFYKCSHGVPVAMSCYGDLLYNPYTEQCDWPSNVESGDRVIPECDDNNNGDNNSNGDNASGGNNNGENGSGDNNNGDNGSGDDNNNGGNGDGDNGNENGTGSCNCNPGEAPSICAGSGSEGLLIAHENCNKFYKCSHGVPVAMSCYGDLLYNPYTEQCDWPSNVECGDRVIPECDDNNNGDNNSNGDNASGGNNNGDNGSGDNNNGDNGSGDDNNNGGNGDGDNGNENGTGSCNCNPGEAPSICAGSGSEGLLIAHENCNKFYKCSHGVPVAMSCYGDLLYNPYTEQCDWPSNVECGDRVIPECDDNNNGDNNSNGDNASGGNNNGENGSGDNNNGDNGSGDDNNNGGNGDGDNGNENGTGSCNCNPGEAPSICAGSGSEGLLIAHENCNQFYKCSHGVPVAMSCYGDLLYNPYTEQCDWASNVECGDRVIPECDDNNNGDNNSNGDNASGGNNNGENGSEDNNNGDNGSGDDNNNGGNGDGDNGNENGTGSCNCNPGEAPSICAGIGSEGTLIAHENCNQFYICSHGVPVSMSCFGDLLYNPYTERCDWPSNVECGERVIPECDDDSNNNGDNNSSGDNASGGNNNGENGSGDNGSGGDNNNGGNGDDNNGNENGTGSCNCNPGQAPSICAGIGSEGTLIAHENCNQFYMCSHGVPVSMSCFGDLLYNPYTERCDWPSNVECGDRVIPECDDDSNNNGDNNSSGDNASGGNNNGENGSGDNGSGGDNNNGGNGDDNNGNENGTGSCNCNPGEAPSICAGIGSEGTLIAHENCNQFYICSHGIPVSMSCFGDLLYNPYTERCDWPSNVECGDRVIPECDDDSSNNGDNNSSGDNASGGNNNGENGSGGNGSGGDNNNGGNGDDNNGNENGTGSCNCNPGEAPSICAGIGSEGILIAHENCNQFYMCSHGVPVSMSCFGDLLYNPYTERCDWPSNVECGDRVIPECDDDSNNNGDNNSSGDNASGGNNNGENGSGDNGSGGDNNNGGNGDNNNGNENETGSCNCNPGEAPSICAGIGSEGTLIAHENCNQFYICSHGVPVSMSCFGDLLYNPYTERCDWPSNVECGDRVIPECDDDSSNNGDNNSSGDNASGGNNNSENGSGGNGSGGDNNNGGNGDDNNGNENGTGSCNCNPGEAPSICAGIGSEGILIAHENCNQFYMCSHGVPVSMSCFGDLLYNPYTERCDWPSNVECGDRVIPECDDDSNNNGDNNSSGDNASGGNNNGENGSGDNGSGGDNNNGGNGDDNNGNENGTGSCNCNPGEAPSICAGIGSEGTLIAHENCNQFYMCSHGVPVSMSCFGDLLYNPYTERCDWPSNVECGDRVVPECDDDSNNNGDNNSSGDNASGGNNNGENGSGDNGSGGDNNNGGNGDDNNGNENGTGSCNCNPGEAPSICAGIGSEGILIAHENCNQFYMCSHGVPVSMSCFGDLLYNPYTERCDWPSNVECGNRVIPECDDDGNNNGDNNSNGDNASGGDNNVDSESGDNNNGDDGSGDDNNNGGNGDGDSGNENGTGSCNCNPGEAPSICAGDGSGGVLIAHENCNQFYKCANGIPVALTCYGDLLYNPYTEQCDWPSNVDCGDRVIQERDEDNNNNGDNTSEGNNNGESDSGNNNNGENGSENGSCNCSPGEAPAICARSESEGMLIAHENCNQFYKCANGVNVALSCYGDLLYNPYTEQCDWPDKVDCGVRIPVDIEDNKDENENESEDNNDDVEEKCDEADVPEVCKSDGSDGVFVAHENCNQFYVCSDKQATILDCPGVLLYDIVSHRCEWPVLVDCGDRKIIETEDNGNNNGGCNCNPQQAPVLCSHKDSDGELIAHENCDQFYKCSNGIPVTFNCTATLLYNPYKQVCDWPQNVDCNGRTLSYFTSMNKHLNGRKLQTSNV